MMKKSTERKFLAYLQVLNEFKRLKVVDFCTALIPEKYHNPTQEDFLMWPIECFLLGHELCIRGHHVETFDQRVVFGRLGESIVSNILTKLGYTVIRYGDGFGAGSSDTFVELGGKRIIRPDIQVVKHKRGFSRVSFVEVKCRSKPYVTNGVNYLPIGKKYIDNYVAFKDESGLPVSLLYVLLDDTERSGLYWTPIQRCEYFIQEGMAINTNISNDECVVGLPMYMFTRILNREQVYGEKALVSLPSTN